MNSHVDCTAQSSWGATTGWTPPRITTDKLSLSADTSFIHYGQAVFEGLRAHLNEAGEITAFRLDDHYRRLCSSARRMALPEPQWSIFFEAVSLFVNAHRHTLAKVGDSLYVRPVLLATTPSLGIAKPISDAELMVTGLANFNHMGDGGALRINVERDLCRAWPGGVGSAKSAGNYGLARLGQARAQNAGCDDALWLSPTENITELSSMNVFGVREGKLLTPPAGELALAGVTRDSVMEFARNLRIPVIENELSISELLADIHDGRVSEMFATGTASGVVPIAAIRDSDREYTIVNSTDYANELSYLLSQAYCRRASDERGWNTAIPARAPEAATGFRADYKIYGYSHSPRHHLRPSVLVRLAQQAAADEQKPLSASSREMKKGIWVVRRNIVRNWRSAPCVSNVTALRTVTGIGSCWLESVTEFLSDDKKLNATVQTFWVQLDPETQMPLALPQSLTQEYEKTGIPTELRWRSMLRRGRRLTHDKVSIERAVSIRDSDIDALGHVNNAIYFDFVDHILDGSDEVVMEYEVPINDGAPEVSVSVTEVEDGLEFTMTTHGDTAVHARGVVRNK